MKQQQLCRKTFHFNVKKRILWRISVLRRYLRSIWSRFLACWRGKTSIRYRHLPPTATAATTTAVSSSSSSPPANVMSLPRKDSSDLVALKISLFGDSHTGKTSFLRKYAGEEKGEEEFAVTGINHVDKTLYVKGARISYSIWEVGGDRSSLDHIPTACKDSVAMLFMFDLTSRCTLNSVIRWYQEARKGTRLQFQ